MGVRAASHTPSRRVKAKQLALTIPGTTVAVGGDDEWIFRMRVPRKGDQTHFNLSLWDTQESVAGNQMPGYFAAILRATQDEGALQLCPQIPQLREQANLQHRFQISHTRRPAGATLEADDALHGGHMPMPPLPHIVFQVHQFLGELVQIPVLFWIRVDGAPRCHHRLIFRIR